MSEYKWKANELRIGNLLKRNGIVVTIDGRSIFDIWDDDGIVKLGYEPIEITEDWLIKFGFKKTYADKCYALPFNRHSLHRLIITLADIGNILTIGDNYASNGENLFVFTKDVVQYVHQVQNVYYSLTNEELTIR